MTPVQAMAYAVKAATKSPCAKSKRGVVVFDEHHILALGHNAPALGTCSGTDACRQACPRICVHAEQGALLNAVFDHAQRRQTRPLDVTPIDMLHVKVVDGHPVASGPPSCAECSKLILESRIIDHVWLLHEIGSGLIALSQQTTIGVSDTLVLVPYTPQDFHRRTLRTLDLPLFKDAS